MTIALSVHVSADKQSMSGTSYAQDSNLVAYVTDNVLTKNGQSIHVEMRTHVFPCQTSGGKCDKAAGLAAAASEPCEELRIVDATFAASL